MYCSQLVYQHTVTFPLWQSYEPSLFKHRKLVNLYCFGTNSLHRYVLWYNLVFFQCIGFLTRSCMESLICLGCSIGRKKNEVGSASTSLYRKIMTLLIVLTDNNTQILFSLCNPCSVHRVHEMQCVQYLFICHHWLLPLH